MSRNLKNDQVSFELLSAPRNVKAPTKPSLWRADTRMFGSMRPSTFSVPKVERAQSTLDIKSLSPSEKGTGSAFQIGENERSLTLLRPRSNPDAQMSLLGRCLTSYTLGDNLSGTSSQRKTFGSRKTALALPTQELGIGSGSTRTTCSPAHLTSAIGSDGYVSIQILMV